MENLRQSPAVPTFEGDALTKWLTMTVDDGRVDKVFYPVFPPNESAEQVVERPSARNELEE